MNTKASIKTAIVGLGGAAQNIHLPLIEHLAELEITAVCSSNVEKANALFGARIGKNIRYFSDYQALLKDAEVELIILLTPNNTHYQMTLDALHNGKDVVVEKPVSVDARDIEDLIVTSKKTHCQIFPFHNRRWDGDYLTVKNLLDSKTLGDIKLFESNFDRFRPVVSDKWKEQGGNESGLWYDIGPHLLDQTFDLFGTPAAMTTRLLAMREGSEAVDYFRAQLHYPDKEVILGASNFCFGPVRRFYQEGSQGTYVKHYLDIQNSHLESGKMPGDEGYGIEPESHFGQHYKNGSGSSLATEQGDYPGFYRSVAHSILCSSIPPVELEAALLVAKFLQLGVLSQEQKKTMWVRQCRD